MSSLVWVKRAFFFGVGLLLGLGLACGPDDVPGGGVGTGPICYQDSDCVPNGCCGTATSAVEKSQAPSCSGQTCTNQCPVEQVNCGCGLPVCQNSHCTVAVTSGGACAGRVAAPAESGP